MNEKVSFKTRIKVWVWCEWRRKTMNFMRKIRGLSKRVRIKLTKWIRWDMMIRKMSNHDFTSYNHASNAHHDLANLTNCKENDELTCSDIWLWQVYYVNFCRALSLLYGCAGLPVPAGTRPDPYPRVRVGSGRFLTGRVGYRYDVHGYAHTRFYPYGTRFFTILEREPFYFCMFSIIIIIIIFISQLNIK